MKTCPHKKLILHTNLCRMAATLIPAALSVFCAGAILSADIITLANGNFIEGKIVSEDEESLTLDIGIGRVILPHNDIVTIEKKPFEYAAKKRESRIDDRARPAESPGKGPPASEELSAPLGLPSPGQIQAAGATGEKMKKNPRESGRKIFDPEFFSWPPKIGEKYPDLALLDHKGQQMRMSSFEGKLIIVEPVGIRWPKEELQGESVKRPRSSWEGIKEFKQYLTRTRQILLPDDNIVYIQIVLFDANLNHPSLRDIQNWVQRYDFRQSRGEYVFITDEDLSGPVSYSLVPGFQLIDKDLILRADSTGENPQDDLFEVLVPLINELRAEIK